MSYTSDFSRALDLLPHGPEFRFLDRVTALVPGRSAQGEYRVRGDEPFLKGHFPGAPLFPGVLLVEATAQLAGVLIQSEPPPFEHLKLTAMRSVKIFGSAVPGEVLYLRAEIEKRLGKLVQVRTSAECRNTVVLQAELTLAGS